MDPSEFERDVRELLQLQGWRVTPEKLLGHKKIDAFAEREDPLGSMLRVAVECKAWDKALSQQDVTSVYVNYQPLIETNHIDTILIVTQSGLSPSAMTYVESTRRLRHLTHLQLLNTLIDFSSHLSGMISAWETEEVSKYYVPQHFTDSEETLEQHLLTWASSQDCQPIAVLGGYGVGKTTLTKRLAAVLSSLCRAHATARIPVVISLAAISTDQTLEGLLGRQFTAFTFCPNYNFQLFLTLNRRGRFILFLDGFDEMKRTMSWDSLMFNLVQLNQLVTPLSKVILLGRPSAFLSDEEQDEALHGKTRQLGKPCRIPDWPDYREVYLRPFSREQIAFFIPRYLNTIPDSALRSEQRYRVRRYLEDIEGPQGKRLLDLAARPVQLKMLMKILPEYAGSVDRLTVAVLYSEFVDSILRREAAKPARVAFTKERRLRFAARIAYWMWQRDQTADINVSRIPDALFEDYLDRVPSDVEIMDVKRDLLSGGFLDQKPPGIFYFPHRSLQEFLVAEEIRYMFVERDDRLAGCSYLTPEITSFFVEIVDRKSVDQLRQRWARAAKGNRELYELINAACAVYGLADLDETVKYRLAVSGILSEPGSAVGRPGVINEIRTSKPGKRDKAARNRSGQLHP
jgi:hypothetical protein